MQDHGRFVCAFALMSIYAVHLQAQTVGAELSGTVRDPAGAVVAGVSISLRNVGTNQTIQTVSNDKGVYRVGPLSPGRYEVTVHCSGDGHAMALRVGAEMAGMEFSQFAAWSYFNRQFFTPGQAKIQGIGARFVNARGEEFMPRYDPVWGNMAGLFQIARGIATENLEGRGPCYVDMRHCSNEDIATLYMVAPSVERAFREFHVNPKTDLLRVDPFVVIGTMSGNGIRIDLQAQSSVEGLFAVGICTNLPIMMTGISGSSPSTFSNVSGYRAGEAAAKMAAKMSSLPVHGPQVRDLFGQFFAPLNRRGQVRPSDIWMAIGEAIARASFALFKNESHIGETRDEIQTIRRTLLPRVTAPDMHEVVKANEVRNYLQIAEVVCEAMLARKESRGELIRIDYPFTDNNDWLKWVIIKQTDPDSVNISFWHLPYDRYPLQAPAGKTHISL
jgi:succinate dehydrogenase/fumarate reductase flavoprotein subunit